MFCFFQKDTCKLIANDFSFSLGLLHTFETLPKSLRRVNDTEFEVVVTLERISYLVHFTFS